MSDEFLPKPFQCDVGHDDGTARVRPCRRARHEHRARARAAAATSCTPPAPAGSWSTCAALEFMDSTGLTLLARWSLGAERDGYAFALIAGSQRIQRLFELTGLLERFTFDAG